MGNTCGTTPEAGKLSQFKLDPTEVKVVAHKSCKEIDAGAHAGFAEQEEDEAEAEPYMQLKKQGGFLADLFGGESSSELGKIYESSEAPRAMKMYTDHDMNNKTIISFTLPRDKEGNSSPEVKKSNLTHSSPGHQVPSVTKMLVAPRRRTHKAHKHAKSRSKAKKQTKSGEKRTSSKTKTTSKKSSTKITKHRNKKKTDRKE